MSQEAIKVLIQLTLNVEDLSPSEAHQLLLDFISTCMANLLAAAGIVQVSLCVCVCLCDWVCVSVCLNG